MGADPDLGRKGFQPELEELSKNIATAVTQQFINQRRYLRRDTGAPPDIISKKNIHEWIRDQELHEKLHPLIIKRQDLFLPLRHPSITSTPLNEQDVIALFHELLAGGVIRGVKVMATNQHTQYDGIFRLFMDDPMNNHIFDILINPLGVEPQQARQTFLSEPKILEYKYSFDSLIEELEREDKSERDISLVVAWKMGKDWQKRYEVTPLLHLDNIQHRYFHGGTHIVKSLVTGQSIFPVIIISELIDYLNDFGASQTFQSHKYMS